MQGAIKQIYEEKLLEKEATCQDFRQVQIENNKPKNRVVKIYNLDLVLCVSRQLKTDIGYRFQDIINNKQTNNKVLDYNNKVIIYNGNNFALDVKISPDEDTVWLSQNQIAILFETSHQNISFHISKILKDNELNDSVCKNYLHTGIDGKSYLVKHYNLDMILAVGYRVKSKRAIEFRRWASNVLKEYLIKGYSTNDNRIINVEKSQLLLSNKVHELENKIEKVEDNLSHLLPKHIFYYRNQSLDAYSFLVGIIEQANKSILVVDPYADRFILAILQNKKKDAEAIIACSNKNHINKEELEILQKEQQELKIIVNNNIHDRYLIIDNEICYQLGSSTNSLGYYHTHIDRIDDINFINNVVRSLKNGD